MPSDEKEEEDKKKKQSLKYKYKTYFSTPKPETEAEISVEGIYPSLDKAEEGSRLEGTAIAGWDGCQYAPEVIRS